MTDTTNLGDVKRFFKLLDEGGISGENELYEKLNVVKVAARESSVCHDLTTQVSIFISDRSRKLEDLQQNLDSLSSLSAQNRGNRIRREALTIIANALFLNSSLREKWVPTQFFADLLEGANHEDPKTDSEYLVLFRILFLLTFTGRRYSRDELKCMGALVRSTILECSASAKGLPDWYKECVKLACTLIVNYPETSDDVLTIIPHLLEVTCKMPIHASADVLNTTCNLLAVARPYEWVLNDTALSCVLNLITELVTTSKHTDDEMSPALSLLFHTSRAVMNSDKSELQQTLKSAVLGNKEDPEKTLSKHLLSLTDTSVMPLGVRLLFETFWLLCDQDKQTFISNFGIGTAMRFLLAFPAEGDGAETDDRITELDTSREAPFEEMTEDEKEQEAERLFVLFDRLEKNGVIKVCNPIREAASRGDFN